MTFDIAGQFASDTLIEIKQILKTWTHWCLSKLINSTWNYGLGPFKAHTSITSFLVGPSNAKSLRIFAVSAKTQKTFYFAVCVWEVKLTPEWGCSQSGDRTSELRPHGNIWQDKTWLYQKMSRKKIIKELYFKNKTKTLTHNMCFNAGINVNPAIFPEQPFRIN